jgi:hypothetical protein
MEKEYIKPELEVISLTSLSDFLMGSTGKPEEEEEGNVNENTGWDNTNENEFGGKVDADGWF